MATRYYLAAHHEQRGTGSMSNTNCAAASAAMLTDQGTLGIKDPGVAWFRKLTDDTDGGLRIGQIASVMEERFGLTVQLYDHRDGLRWPKLVRMLKRGFHAVVAGDYDVLPPKLQGADYGGFHAVVYHQRFRTNQRVGDPLMPDWNKWDNDLAYRYVRKFDAQTQGGIHAAVMVPQYARLRAGVVRIDVLADPAKDAAVIGTMHQTQKLVTGGTVKGDSIANVDRWRKVWLPSASRTGYVHWTTTWKEG